MRMHEIPFGTTDWATVAREERPGERGRAGWRTREFGDGRMFVLRPGMSYQVADGAEPHRSSSESGATLFIVG